MTPDNEPLPAASPLQWGTISADEMSRVVKVETKAAIIPGGELRASVVATFSALQRETGEEYFASETVYTCNDIRLANRAAHLFLRACEALTKLTAEPSPTPEPMSRRVAR